MDFRWTWVIFQKWSVELGIRSNFQHVIYIVLNRTWGIYFDDGHCKNVYETNDALESDRNQYNPVLLTSNETYLLVKGNRAQSVGLEAEQKNIKKHG